MNVVIFGGRDFSNYSLLKEKCNKILKNIDNITIFSGKAKGADSLGETYTDEKNYIKRYFPAKWNDLNVKPCVIKYNRYGQPYNVIAGYNRNQEMVNEADLAIGFWNGKSKGTKDMINRCKKKGIKLKIIKY